ncbi:hypothetical protein [Burkholderia cepacia]|uniref:hypothetical protein n=1 Tax=Burkholderia cepacia TaxID=292 RepID=UPI0012D8B213|nr:hypothetical protein [Burkholderia cepacia]
MAKDKTVQTARKNIDPLGKHATPIRRQNPCRAQQCTFGFTIPASLRQLATHSAKGFDAAHGHCRFSSLNNAGNRIEERKRARRRNCDMHAVAVGDLVQGCAGFKRIAECEFSEPRFLFS